MSVFARQLDTAADWLSVRDLRDAFGSLRLTYPTFPSRLSPRKCGIPTVDNIFAVKIVKQFILRLTGRFYLGQQLAQETEAAIVFRSQGCTDYRAGSAAGFFDRTSKGFLRGLDIAHLGGNFTQTRRQQGQAIRTIA